MISSILKIDFNDFTEAIPSYIAIIAMPFMYSISEGIAMGRYLLRGYQRCNRPCEGEENQPSDVYIGYIICT